MKQSSSLGVRKGVTPAARRKRRLHRLTYLLGLLEECESIKRSKARVPGRRQRAALDCNVLIENEQLFFKLTRLTYKVWYQCLFVPLAPRMKRTHIPKKARLIRFCMHLCGATPAILELFGQSRWTVNRDLIYIARLMCDVLYDNWIYLAEEREIAGLKKNDAFSRMPNVLYACDGVVTVGPRQCVRFDEIGFSVKHQCYGYTHLVLCDSAGFIRGVSGPVRASVNDATHWNHSQLRTMIERYD